MLSILITGANRGLGYLLTQRFLSLPELTQLFVSARDVNLFDASLKDERIIPLALDLTNNPASFYESDFYHQLPHKLDIAIHCAAPYQTVPLMQASQQELLECVSVNGMDTLLLCALAHRIKSGGTLLVAGSVSGERYCNPNTSCRYLHAVMNDPCCSLHALHKGILRDLIYCLHIEQPTKRIIYASISGFKDEVKEEEKDTYLTTFQVAEQFMNLALETKKPQSYCIEIVAKKVANKINKIRSYSAEFYTK